MLQQLQHQHQPPINTAVSESELSEIDDAWVEGDDVAFAAGILAGAGCLPGSGSSPTSFISSSSEVTVVVDIENQGTKRIKLAKTKHGQGSRKGKLSATSAKSAKRAAGTNTKRKNAAAVTNMAFERRATAGKRRRTGVTLDEEGFIIDEDVLSALQMHVFDETSWQVHKRRRIASSTATTHPKAADADEPLPQSVAVASSLRRIPSDEPLQLMLTPSVDIVQKNISAYTWFFPDVGYWSAAAADSSASLAPEGMQPVAGHLHVSLAYPGLPADFADEQFMIVTPKSRAESYQQCGTRSGTGVAAPDMIESQTGSPAENDDADDYSYDPVVDLRDSLQVVASYSLAAEDAHLLSLKLRLEEAIKQFEMALEMRERDQVAAVMHSINTVLRQARLYFIDIDSGSTISPPCSTNITLDKDSWLDICEFVLHQAYTRVVAPHVCMLKNYAAFSSYVYGELRPPFIRQLIHQLGFTRDSVFIDLGSGIGNVVLQIAAQTGCEAHGIEIMDAPMKLAAQQIQEWKSRMKAFRLPHGHTQLHHGDFLQHPVVPGILKRATHVLVTNFVFSPDMNRQVLQLLLDLTEGTHIVALQSFVPRGFRASARNENAIEQILRTEVHEYGPGWVSWTATSGTYYVHTIDRASVQRRLQGASDKAPL